MLHPLVLRGFSLFLTHLANTSFLTSQILKISLLELSLPKLRTWTDSDGSSYGYSIPEISLHTHCSAEPNTFRTHGNTVLQLPVGRQEPLCHEQALPRGNGHTSPLSRTCSNLRRQMTDRPASSPTEWHQVVMRAILDEDREQQRSRTGGAPLGRWFMEAHGEDSLNVSK